MATAPGGVKVDATGIIQVSTSLPIAGQVAKWPLAADGTVCVSLEASQARTFQNGFPYDMNGRLIVDPTGPSIGTQNCFGFNVQSGLVASANPVTNDNAGLGYDSTTGLVCMSSLGPILGPNLLTNPNGDYTLSPWSAAGLTSTTGATDPLGGNTADLLTDTAVNSAHAFDESVTFTNGQKYLITLYFEPGTYTGGITFELDSSSQIITVTGTGVAALFSGTATNLAVSTVGGFFKVTFNFVGAGGSVYQIFFGQSPSYLGLVQNQTFWGAAVQTST